MDTPPGWYADPAAPRTLRWWDGHQWTEHTQPVLQASPYAGGPIAAPTGPTTEDGEPLAGWWWRVLALVIDVVIVWVATTLLTLPVNREIQRDQETLQRELERAPQDGESIELGSVFSGMLDSYADHALLLFGLPLLLTLAYHATFLLWRGATPGKLICGLQVRRRDAPGRLSIATVALRLGAQPTLPNLVYAAAFASRSVALILVASLFYLAYTLTDVLMATGERRQALHDRVAGTVVVRTRR